MLEVRCVCSTQCFAPLLFCSTHASCSLKRPYPCGSGYWLLQGAFTHQDFAGHKGTIRTGDVQWMTAGRGIVHSEMPAGDDVHKGLQLWINLSSKYKMIEPQYQELERKDISRGESENGGVEALGVATPVYTHPHHVCGLHHAPRVSPAPARPGGLECLRLRR
jgi:quercetin 2,3-dioxygenase